MCVNILMGKWLPQSMYMRLSTHMWYPSVIMGEEPLRSGTPLLGFTLHNRPNPQQTVLLSEVRSSIFHCSKFELCGIHEKNLSTMFTVSVYFGISKQDQSTLFNTSIGVHSSILLLEHTLQYFYWNTLFNTSIGAHSSMLLLEHTLQYFYWSTLFNTSIGAHSSMLLLEHTLQCFYWSTLFNASIGTCTKVGRSPDTLLV